MRYCLGLCVAMWMALVAGASAAQDMRWIQIEAQPSLLEAETRARIYAQEFPDTQAHSIGSGWYAITLGPLPEDEAARLMPLSVVAHAVQWQHGKPITGMKILVF
ncbi:MAG: hypothetical protein EBZ32_06965 [Rhodobacteraceae bacterium]|nr:hypothetical protein [Paracoccaceae bacterium]